MSAVDHASELLDLLRRASDDAEAIGPALRRLDSAALLAWSAEREAVRERAARLEHAVRESLGDGPRSEAAAALLAAIRKEAARLRRIDADNAALAARTLRVVRGYVGALAPAPEAYDRRGLARAGAR